MDCVHGAHVSPVEIYISQVVAWANVEVDVILPDDGGWGAAFWLRHHCTTMK